MRAASNLESMRKFAKELVDFAPDAILATSTAVTAALQHETQTIPIVFAIVGDPVGSGFVASLSRPGRNITGLGVFEESMPSKWLDLLREIAPGVKRATFMFNPETAPYINSFLIPPFEAAAAALKIAAECSCDRQDRSVPTRRVDTSVAAPCDPAEPEKA
jgi:putative tryptophan/tyrosine transport system substrate-binding protein